MRRAWAAWARVGVGAGALAAALAWAGAGTAAEAPLPGNSCVNCHEHLPEGTRIAKRHLDFVGSVHDRAGVTCERCHGGDPAAPDKAGAHAGVKDAGDAQSTIYFRNVPRTCGRCHDKELAAFSRSRHFAQLQTTGRGPNCVTCHGSMATRVLKAADVEGFCVVCHNPRMEILPDKPAQAEAILELRDAVRTLLAWGRESVDTARARGAATDAAERELAAAAAELGLAGRAWHTFDLTAIQAHLGKALKSAQAARAALPEAAAR